MPRRFAILPLLLVPALIAAAQSAPDAPPLGQLDPTRAVASPQLFSSFHQPLAEQYIWTHDQPRQTREQAEAPRWFRAHFLVEGALPVATLYIAGGRNVDAYINGERAGQFAADPNSRLDEHVYYAEVHALLHAGDNVIAIQADHGDHLVVKLAPATLGENAPASFMSGPGWKATTQPASGWEAASFDDSAWPAAEEQGAIESNIDFFQWNRDAGMYNWPGYEGASPFLAHTYLPAVKVVDAYAGEGSFQNVDALTQANADPQHEFSLEMQLDITGAYTPYVTLDFGREVTGRVQIVSDSESAAMVSIAYGESLDELQNEPYLGDDAVMVNAHSSAVGPKSAFRYARVRFLAAPHFKAKDIRLEDIYYPVHYLGSFESSDELLNRIWETGVYTSHLCMQDDIWDAPKRDRGRWMGDTDVSGRVIDAVFADQFLVEDTLSRLIGPVPIAEHVNGIPGYSSYWFTELADFVRHTGQTDYVKKEHEQLLQLLAFMDKDFDAQGNFINHTKEWLYVDWANGLNGDTPETRKATPLEYIRAYREAAWLLRQIGDTQNADHWEQRAAALSKTSQDTAFSDGSFGPRWQTNSMAVLAGVATPEQYGSIWSNVLQHVGEKTYRPDVVSPYYGSYVLDALAEVGHREAGLAWIREYWGGMIQEGATSFWEAYDPAWPKSDSHVDLQADDTAGYRISLAHGWSSGPSYWLMEQVLGIQPTGPGFAQTTIRPDLLGLTWARGAEPTPHGLLSVSLSHKHDEHSLHMVVDLPAGIDATVLYPAAPGTGRVTVNGAAATTTPVENGARVAFELKQAGHYEIHAE